MTLTECLWQDISIPQSVFIMEPVVNAGLAGAYGKNCTGSTAAQKPRLGSQFIRRSALAAFAVTRWNLIIDTCISRAKCKAAGEKFNVDTGAGCVKYLDHNGSYYVVGPYKQ